MIRYDAFTTVSGVLVIAGVIAMLIATLRMNKMWKTADFNDDDDRALIRRRARQLNIGSGLLQITIGLLLISMGNYAGSIAVLGMGVVLVVVAHMGLITGERQDRRRPTQQRDS